MKASLSFLIAALLPVAVGCNMDADSKDSPASGDSGGTNLTALSNVKPDDNLAKEVFLPLNPKVINKNIDYKKETQAQEEERIKGVLTSEDIDSDRLAKLPGMKIAAHEASFFAGTQEFSHVVAFRNEQYDLFMLHQYDTRGDTIPTDFKEWRKYAIVVDKFRSPVVMYFYRIMKGDIALTDGRPGDDCTHCHASGPRAVRPRKSPIFKDLTPEEFKNIAAFNAYVKSYGSNVVNHMTAESPSLYDEQNRLKMPKCVVCHSVGGTRGALYRHQKPSITTLTISTKDDDGYHRIDEKAATRVMPPPPSAPLTAEEIACLKKWLDNETIEDSCKAPLGL